MNFSANGLFSLSSRWSWPIGHDRRKWIRRSEFKSWTRLFAFHIALILFKKVWIQVYSLHLWRASGTVWVLSPWHGNRSRRRKTLYSNLLNSIIKLTLCHTLLNWRAGIYLQMYIYIYILWKIKGRKEGNCSCVWADNVILPSI